MLCKLLVTVGLGIAIGAGSCTAQDVGAENLPGATRVVRPPEVPVPGLTKRDADTVALALPGTTAAAELLVHDFDFNGEPVSTDKIHLRQVAPGVVEITSVAWEVKASGASRSAPPLRYYGSSASTSDTLDHTHTIVKKSLHRQRGRQRHLDLQAHPDLHEHHRLRRLRVDTTGEATFDLNASDRYGKSPSTSPRAPSCASVLFTGPQFPAILSNFTAPRPGRRAISPALLAPSRRGRPATTTRTRSR